MIDKTNLINEFYLIISLCEILKIWLKPQTYLSFLCEWAKATFLFNFFIYQTSL